MSKKSIIMKEAIDLFSKNGIESTSIQDITNACGISKGAFYLSFKSKDDLLLEITDYFIKKFIAKQNQILEETPNGENQLSTYFYYNFNLLEEHHTFISMCMHENFQPMNSEILNKIKEFNAIQNKILLTIIEKTFGNEVNDFKYDLLLVIRGLLISYTEFITTRSQKFDFKKLSVSLAEKVKIIAKHSKIHVVTEECWNSHESLQDEEIVSKEHIYSLIQQFEKQDEKTPIIEETIHLLKEEFKKEKPSIALLTGLISNLQIHEDFSLLVFSIKEYISYVLNNSK